MPKIYKQLHENAQAAAAATRVRGGGVGERGSVVSANPTSDPPRQKPPGTLVECHPRSNGKVHIRSIVIKSISAQATSRQLKGSAHDGE